MVLGVACVADGRNDPAIGRAFSSGRMLHDLPRVAKEKAGEFRRLD
jgi:hypothetical protein